MRSADLCRPPSIQVRDTCVLSCPIFASKECSREGGRGHMDQGIVEQVLDELIPSFEALGAQSTAIAQLLKDRGIAKEDQLAPYLEQAKSSSSIRWRATRLRMERILSSTTKTTEESTKQVAAEPKEKASPKPEEEARGQTPSA